MRNKPVVFGIFVVIVLVVWNIFEYLYVTLMVKSTYQFHFMSNIGYPLLLSIIIGFLLILRDSDK